MSLPLPHLDDRDLESLMSEAVARLRQACPEWTDLSPGDPGMALIEVFAYLTETLLFRLNKVPERTLITLLNLVGVQRQSSTAAIVTLAFKRRDSSSALDIPRGTEVTSRGPDGPVFRTLTAARFDEGVETLLIEAIHAEQIDAELAGLGSGLPGQLVTSLQIPILQGSQDELDLVVGIEVPPNEIDALTQAVRHEDRIFRLWRETESFAQTDDESPVYVVDRSAGQIRFAPALRLQDEQGGLEATPAALAAVPPAGRQIRLWYRRGGGASGNVRAHTLTVMRRPIDGVTVDNPSAAAGGADEESVANAIARGPLSLYSLERAVTSRDFELLAVRRSSAVNRARAFTQAALWAHGTPGTAEILLVPQVADSIRSAGRISREMIEESQSEMVLRSLLDELDQRRPLGTSCRVAWAGIKVVSIELSVRLHPQENADAVRARVLTRLHRLVCPVNLGPGHRGWPFGQKLTSWDILKSIGSEAGVSAVESVRLVLEEAPDSDIGSLAADAFQANTFYCASGSVLFRTTNGAESWEVTSRFEHDWTITAIRTSSIEAGATKDRAGKLAIVARNDTGGSRLSVSRDAAESMQTIAEFDFEVLDIAWLYRDRTELLLLASAQGLYEIEPHGDATPRQVLVDADHPTLGILSIAVSADSRGRSTVAVAAADEMGVYLSHQSGTSGTFAHGGLRGELLRVLMMQHVGSQRFLWAGLAATGPDAGKGCLRLRLAVDEASVEYWEPVGSGWAAGSCLALSFDGHRVYAGSHRLGVLSFDCSAEGANWAMAPIDSGLPLRDVGRLQPVNTLAADRRRVIAGGPTGVYRSGDAGLRFRPCGERVFDTDLALPLGWVFCSGEHRITVESRDETGRH